MTRPNSVPFPLVVGAVVVALGAALVFRGASTSSPPQTKPDQTPGTQGPSAKLPREPVTDPLSPLRRFLDAEALSHDNKERADADLLTKLKPYQIECIIATIPHPTQSGLGYWYDLSIDAIARAVETAGFVPYSAFTPPGWPQLAEDKKRETSAAAVRQEQPGMLLFRSTNPESKDLRIVWLVGETPTSGIDNDAFQKSVDFVRDFGLRTHQSENSQTLRILGPFFSGSQQSLLMALHNAKHDKGVATFVIRNGSATAIEKGPFDNLGANYKTTVIPYGIVRTEVLRYLANPSSPRTNCEPVLPKMAVLHESDTIFGRKPLNKKDKTDKDNNDQEKSDGAVIEIPFPIHISELQGVPS
jgi:hypothetical protein